MEADFSGKGLMQSGEDAETALQPWDEEKESMELLEEEAKERVGTEVHEERENEDGDRELQPKRKNDGDESDFEFPSFMDELSMPSLPGFHPTPMPSLAVSRDICQTTCTNHGDVLGDLEDASIDDDDEEGNYGPKSDDELPSFLDDLSTPSLPGFSYTKSSLLVPSNSRDDRQPSRTDHGDVLGGLDNERKGNEKEEDQGRDGLVS